MRHYDRYRAIRHNLTNNLIDFSARHELLIDTAFELFEDIKDFAAADATSHVTYNDRPPFTTRVEVDLEGGLFVAERSGSKNYQRLKTALAATAPKTGFCYDVVRNTFLKRTGTYISSLLFRSQHLDVKQLIHLRPKDMLSRYEFIGAQASDDSTFGLEVISSLAGLENRDQLHLRPVEESLGFTTTHSIVSFRLHETLDLMAGLSGSTN